MDRTGFAVMAVIVASTVILLSALLFWAAWRRFGKQLLSWAFSGIWLTRWEKQDRWGINLNQLSCPKCQTLIPVFRWPRSIKQALWGGATCPNCGCEMDKWGRTLSD
jgi:hypothetical protein